MWETLISWYINNYLGKYVENLNSQQLSFALRQGELELENVPLKKNIFRSWGLPIEVRSGVVGRIKIEFNILKYFRNEPVLVFIEDVYLVAGPLNLSEWDPVEEEILCHEAKMSALDGHEARWKAHNDLASNASSYYSTLYFSSMRIGASIVTKVVENLQLQVRNVHIRFEDDIGDSRHRVMAFGITLESLTAQSCDSHWSPLSSVQGGSFESSYKTLQLNKFGIYCDTKAERFSHYKPQELKDMMRKLLVTHEYILHPVSAEARISKNNSTNPLSNSFKPRFDVHLTLEKVPLNLSDSQFRQSYLVFKSFRKLERNCRLRHYRPFVQVKGTKNVKDWWQYALRAILTIRGYKRRTILKTWDEVLMRGRDNVAYVNAYEQHLLRELLSGDAQKLKDRVETELHYEEIIILREVAIGRVEATTVNSQPSDTNMIPNSKSMDNISNSNLASPTSETGPSQGMLSWVFPSWSRWVSSAESNSQMVVAGETGSVDKNLDDELSPMKSLSSSVLSDVSLSESKLHQSEMDLDEAILDDMKAFGRDALLGRFHFILKQGSVTLKKKSGPFLEFEFTGVDLRTELRPRSGSHKFQMTLSSVYLRDCSTNSLIISPHPSSTGKPGGLPTTAKEIREPLFRLSYERKSHQKTAHRVSVTTKPLDLVLYPILWEDVHKYFTVNSIQDELEIPHGGYEAMKQRTKEEIKTYWERLINQHKGNSLGGGAPSWDIIMNISAPQIVVHGAKESRSNIKKIYSKMNTSHSGYRETPTKKVDTGSHRMSSTPMTHDVEPFVVIDLGRFHFTNLSESELIASEEENCNLKTTEHNCGKNSLCDSTKLCSVMDEDTLSDDEFLTPCSSPVPEMVSPQSCVNSPRASISDISEAPTIKSPTDDDGDAMDGFGDLHNKLYKKYRLEITDVQIIVVEGKSAKEGSWRTAVARGTSPLHLVDKFSINLQLERRLIYSEDPLWPALTLVATLPKWSLHFNEIKILTMRGVLSSFFSSSKLKEAEEFEKLRLSTYGGSQVSLQDDSMMGSLPGHPDTSKMETDFKSSESLGKKSESKLFLAQFTIQNITVEIQSRGRSIAELQIIGARTSFTVRPLDTSISFVIQSLLLADAVQTFGPDFELLLASHKHVSMDSVSGSLRDSDPTSPMSPQSPSCPSPGPYTHARTFPNQLPIPSQLHDALVTSLQTKRVHKTKGPSLHYDSHTPLMDVDALITAELVLVNTDEDLAILSVQFNNLDLIANQETVVEILQFLQRAFPAAEIPSQQLPKSEAKLINTGSYRLQTSFDFHRLNILLVRGIIGKDGNQCARKICCATASEARVNFAIHNNGDVVIDGSLGGLQMLNLTPEGQHHQKILSVGQDPLVDPSYHVFSHATTKSTITDDLLASSNAEALTFSFEKFAENDPFKPPVFKLRMASVIYTHCPMFLIDLKKCISEFQEPLALKIRTAAAQIAFGLIRQDGPSNTYRSPSGSLSGSLDRLNVDEHGIHYSDAVGGESCTSVVELDIILDSPVIVLPKTRSSPEVLVANLGQITVSGSNKERAESQNFRSSSFSKVKLPSNFTTPNPSHMDSEELNDKEGISYNVFVCDISLYSLDLSEKWSMMENLKYTFPTSNTASIMTAQELYHCDPATSKPILHNTVIQFNICYREDPPFVNVLNDDMNNSTIFPTDDDKEPYMGPKLELQGRVVNPLKVSLTPKQYSQLLDSLNNIAGGDDAFNVHEINIETHTNETKMRWKREFYAMHHEQGKLPHVQLPLPSPTRNMDDSLPILAAFEIPELIVELVLPEVQPKRKRRRKVNKEEPHLSLSCSDLSFECDKKGFLTEMKLSLKSLTLEDTSVPASSPQRFLAMSNTSLTPEGNDSSTSCNNSTLVTTSSVFQNHNRYMSTSCPDIPKSIPILIPDTPSSFINNSYVRSESASLPDHLDPSDIFTGRFFVGRMNSRHASRSMGSKRRCSVFGRSSDRSSEEKSGFYPVTPPPSPLGNQSERFVNLVQIQMCLVDPKSPNFISKYHGTHKFVDVDFNALEILLTPETFICLRQFFAEAGKYEHVEKDREQKLVTTNAANITIHGVPDETKGVVDEDKDTETKINVKALSVKIATKKGTLAEGKVKNVMCHLVNRGKDFFGVEGRLGSLQIKDVSPHAGKYPVKFTFQGQQALDFDYYRKEHDAKFRLQMSSVICVHTNRFYTEFSSLFFVLFGSLGGNEYDSVSQNIPTTKLSDDKTNSNKTHVSLDIQAGAPVLLFPYSASSSNLLVADLGHLSVRNKIVQESQNVFCDRISVDLIEMDLFAAEVQERGNLHMSHISKENLTSGVQKLWFLDKKCVVVKTIENTSFLKEKCALKLKVKRILNREDVDLSQAAISVEGTLSTVCCFLDPGKYKLIRGLLEFNIGEKLDMDQPITSTPMRGRTSSFASSIGSPKEHYGSAVIAKKELSIELELVNVTAELVNDTGNRLSRVDFVKSKFTFHNYSDGTRDVDLASQDILICDSRFKTDTGSPSIEQSQNVFTNILQQSSATGAVNLPSQSQAPSSFQSSTHIQAEVHYRLTQRGSSSTIVLNNMRLMLILDWWMELRTFLSQKGPTPEPITVKNEMDVDGLSYVEIKEKKLLASPVIKRSRRAITPVTVSAGIVTKRAPILDIPESTFELKVNVSNCELVVVEDPSVWDTNAIILKSTAVLNYKPHLERPVTCSLLQCELFSCILGLESDTALSILDPTDITFELVRKTKMESLGILDATLSPSNSAKILRVQSPHLILRLSYNDMKMFVQLMERFSKQAQYHFLQADAADLSVSSEDPPESISAKKPKVTRAASLDESSVQQLVSMGFTRLESEEALQSCDGKLDDAALALSENMNSFDSACRSSPIDAAIVTSDDASSIDGCSETSKPVPANNSDGQLSGIEVKCTFLSVCVIDDCKDADVPLLELNVNQLELEHNCIDNSGQAECVLGGDYFNRELSGWEPFLEQWKCSVGWKKNDVGQIGIQTPGSEFPPKAPALELSISSRQIMNFNVTSTLLNLYTTVSSNWSEEYDKQKVDKRRAPFVPFVLKNETGSELWFSAILPNTEDLIKQQRNLTVGTHIWSTSTSYGDNTNWIHVANGSHRPFSFEGRGKLRHRNSHQIRTHQLAVRVDGWQEIIPVSLDKVGTYFRVAKPALPSVVNGSASDLPYTRLVFEVILQGSAQKLVRVRSALLLKNSLNEPIELKLENTIIYPSFAKQQTGGSFLAQLKPGEAYPIPLHSVWAQLWVRPISEVRSPTQPSLYRYCENHLLGNTDDSLRSCDSLAENQLEPYRFCVAVQKDEFPADEDDLYRMSPKIAMSAAAQYLQMSKKVNVLTLVSPLNIVNLLPVEICYEIKGKNIKEMVSPGKESRLTNINTAGQVEIAFHLENFPHGGSVSVSANNNGFVSRLKIMDSSKRPLILTVRVTKSEGNSISVYLSCPYWIVNKTGIPILCKQEGTADEAAGQFQEHEVGRMVAPLLFSFPDQEGLSALTLRVGTKVHADSKPHWCRSLYVQNGMQVRKLNVSVPSPRTEIVYLIGIEIKNGRGRYRDSKLITIAPRFTIDNRSSKEVQISQRHLVTSFFDMEAESTYLKLTPGCNLPFHWPRLDKDQLLCVRLADAKGSLWSGGFPIENVDSFHIPVRHWDGACNFLRVEIIVQGPTYFIVLGDTDKLPPPFRVDNFSFVPILFHQTAVGDERLKLTAKSESCCPFAWDEPTQPPHLTLAAPGGTSVVISMDTLGFASHLTYENFFYIAFTATFPSDDLSRTPTVGMEALQLVLDVEGVKVVLRRKEPGKRSQLWRVNVDGLIEHEGSSAPREPRKPPRTSFMVLDIAGTGPQPNQYIPLMLRKPDKRRVSTQHWEFTADGRLKCETLDNLYVQAKDGFGTPSTTVQSPDGKTNVATWNMWNDVVLGPDQPICYSRTDTGIPAEQAVSKQKLRPGSGRLTLNVDTDGPTRVLRIIDIENPPKSKMLHHEFEESDCNTVPKLLANINLRNGLGISIINCKPREELIYIRLSSLHLKYSDSKESELVEASVDNFQIDNQLLEAEKSLAVYVVPSPRYEIQEFPESLQPALHLTWQRMKSKLNAHVFKSWELTIKPLSVILEERLLLKLCHWIGLSEKFQSNDGLQESDFDVQKALTNATSLTAKRFYFGDLTLTLNQVRLSVLTSSKLSSDLAMIKRRLGLTLIRFEDAQVELDPFAKQHPFETFEFLFASLVKHYRDELLSQAAIILGSTDFLGNPLGFVNDVSVGVTGLIYEGSLGSLVKNVTHGLSNSAAKVTGSLGDGLGRTTLDEKHEEERRKIRDDSNGSSGEHLVAGLRGLAHGIMGGITSIVAQSFDGAASDGITGFVAGMGKGIVGTVTKPAVGILDLATGAASAIRDSSRTSSRMVPERCRPPRVATGNGGLLPVYSDMASRGQELLYEVNDRNFKELFIGHETLISGPGRDLRVLVSSQAVIVFKPSKGNPVILKVPMSELIESRLVLLSDKKACIELVHRLPDERGGYGQLTRPQVSCENEAVARRVVEQVNHAKVLYEEMRHSQIEKPNSPIDY